jgi:hypothetical protein
MTEVKPVRLIRDFAHFPPGGVITLTWHRGDVIEDPEVIALLISLAAPLELVPPTLSAQPKVGALTQ